MKMTSKIAPAGASELTLAHVLQAMPSFDVAPQARQAMGSAINTFCRVVGRAPKLVPAHIPTLRQLMASASPGSIGLSATRWRNVKTSVNRALRLAGLMANGPSAQAALGDGWESLAAAAPTATERGVMRRFARYCSDAGLAPQQVSDETVAAYLGHLDANQISKTPLRSVKDLIRIWNRVAATGGAKMRPLSDQKASRAYVLPWSELPLALAADARAFRERSLNPDWFDSEDDRQAVRPATADQRDRMLRRLATAELLAGVAPIDLVSLADLVAPDNLRVGLAFMLQRSGGKPNRQVFEMAQLALTIARHQAKLPESDLLMLKKWMKRFKPAHRGMTEKNKDRLRQFAGNNVIARLLALPARVYAELEQQPVTPMAARRAQRALMLAILLAAPMRLKNLRSLDRVRHFRQAFSTEHSVCHIVLPADEVKNNKQLEYALPPALVSMIDRYMEVYRPLLGRAEPSLLFPGWRKGGDSLTDTGARLALVPFVKKELGLAMNPHLFRHLAAYTFLKINPGEYETVRQLLGHKNIQTTIDFYSGLEADEASRRYADVLGDYVEQHPADKRRKG